MGDGAGKVNHGAPVNMKVRGPLDSNMRNYKRILDNKIGISIFSKNAKKRFFQALKLRALEH